MGSIEGALLVLDANLAPDGLSNLQEQIVRGSWDGQTYAQIAEATGYDDDYIRDVGFQLWRKLSKNFNVKVSKSNFKTILRRQQVEPLTPPDTSPPAPHDWSTAADVSLFYGRKSELTTLTQWVQADLCRLILILGMGGMGKSAFAIKLAHTLEHDFEQIIWRSLKAAPPLEDLLTNLLKTFAASPDVAIPTALPDKIAQCLEYLRQKRCLLILDNFDVLLESNQHCGLYQAPHQDYGEFLQHLGDVNHQSTVLITSREKPQDIDGLEGDRLPVRTTYLKGLDQEASQSLLKLKGLTGTPPEQCQLIEHYQGHPLALKMISTTISELFGGDIAQYLNQRHGVFNGLERLLALQIQRLSQLETDILFWLAINQNPCTLAQLQGDLLAVPPIPALLEALESLKHRSLLETTHPEGDPTIRFTLQPVIMEYLLHTLIQQVFTEIKTLAPKFFLRYALLKAQLQDYLQDTQARLILAPLARQLQAHFEGAIASHLQTFLKHLQTLPSQQIGYGGGNLINLFRYLQTDLRGYDFSTLTLRQALLHDLSLRDTNFSHVTFQDCRFANTFGGITAVAFSPDGEQFATCDTNGHVAVWSMQGRHPLAQCIGHDFWTWNVAFHPTLPRLASCGQDLTVRLWDTRTGHCEQVLHGHTSIVLDVTFSPDGQCLLSSSNDGSIKQWDAHTGDCLQTLVGHEKCVWGLAFAPDGQHFYSGGEDNQIRYWDLATGECLRVFSGHRQWIMAIALSPDGLWLASASMDHTVKLWSTATGACLHTLTGHQAPVVSVDFSPDGRTLASGSYDQTIRLWHTRTGTCTQLLNKHTNRIWCVQFHPHEPLLASGGDDNTTRFWNPDTGEALTTLQGYSNGIYELALHPHLPMIASAHEDQTVRLWHLPAENSTDPVEPYQTLRGHQNRVFAIAFSPDGNHLASGSFDRTIKLWHPETHQCSLTLVGHQSWVWDIAFSPDSQTLASASYDRTVKLWDIQTGHCTQTLTGHDGSALCVAFSPDGQWLASGGYEQILKLWDPQSGECLRTWHAHPNRIWAVAFSPDNQMLATAGEDHQIMLWDVATGAHLQTLCGHQQAVLCLRFSDDGQYLFSSGSDRTLKQWHLGSAQCLQTFSGHEQWVWSVALASPHQCLSASQDETIRVWDITTGTINQQLEVPRPYAGMNIQAVTGLTNAQENVLSVLGAYAQPDREDGQ
ncbi:MAG: NB-ARC domain-containing protein [Thermosynechococcaceae cyanobacterium]